ncbi:chlororespiratory reduction 6 domain-containing protein [bacterium]|nr:chlororespiratory reduction 6 domain-containing protein [bacterium]
MEIKISNEEILSGDISKIKNVVEDFILDRCLSLENENKIAIKFAGFTAIDLSKKLMEERYKTWFKKLDTEFPQLPFFLNNTSKTLLFFMMGCVDYSINNTSIVFNETEKNKFTKEKAYKIKHFCLGHNIDPTSAIERLSLSEPQAKKPQTIETYLKKFRSIACMTKERNVKISILIDEIPSKMNVLGVFLVESGAPQPFFPVFLQLDNNIIEYKAVILTNYSEIRDYCREHLSVKIEIIISTDSDYQSYPELDKTIQFLSLPELDPMREQILEAAGRQQNSGENTPENPEKSKTEENRQNNDDSPDKTLPLTEETPDKSPKETEKAEEKESLHENIEEKIPENETLEQKVARLEKENRQLQEKIKQQNNIIEAYEEEINKKRSVKGFLRGFFK